MRINTSETGKTLLVIGKTLLVVIVLISSLTSCMNMRKFVYFHGMQDTLIRAGKTASLEPVIQKNDLLSITVSSLNPDASLIFNTPNQAATSPSMVAGNSLTIGYLVNQDGYIQFPLLDSIHAAGLNKKQLTAYITDMLTKKKLLLDPIVTIRYLNFKVSVLGEVARPGVFAIPNEKVTILEALGLAGDLTIYARRDNLILIREQENGEKIFRRINLGSSAILSSPYYYLKSNDVIYVEPNRNKVASISSALPLMPAILGGLSLLIVILDRSKF